jgi:hypothetical protein
MRTIPRMRAGLCALLATSLATSSTPARAIDKVACVDAAEAGQRLRKEGRLVLARDRLVVCASPDCPEVVSQDCTGWLGEVQRSLASVIVKVRSSRGESVSDVGVSLDGVVLAERAPTATIEIDPGDHVFRCERAGFGPAEQRVHLAQGERGREITCQLASLAQAAPPESIQPTPKPEETPGDEQAARGSLPWIVWPLGGLGVTGVGAFAALYLSARADEKSLLALPRSEGGCAPYCSNDSRLWSIETKLNASYISLAVGLVALGAAALIGLLHSSAPASRVSTRAQARQADLPLQLLPQTKVVPLQYPLQH